VIGLQSEVSMLELDATVGASSTGGKGIKIEMQKEFRLGCVCGQSVSPFSNNLLPFDVPFGKCAATKVMVSFLFSYLGNAFKS
jgi:hypothetical protein